MISVIIPIYNIDKYLEKSIESVLHQTYENLEIILVDDGSVDNCPMICDNYARVDARIKVIHKENGGLSSARNVGIEIATGEYIAFVDGDDYILPNMCERMLSEMRASEADIVMCSYLNVDKNGNFLDNAKISAWFGSGIDLLKTDGLRYNYAWNKLYRKVIFDEIRFPDGKLFEDMYIMHNVFQKARKVSIIPDALYVYRKREDSISADLASHRRIDFIEALVERIEFLVKIDAEESPLFYFIMQMYITWNRLYQAGALKSPSTAERWNRCYARFRLSTKGIARGWRRFRKLSLSVFRLHPQLLRLALAIQHRVKRFLK